MGPKDIDEDDTKQEIPDSYTLQSQLALPYMPTPQYAIDHIIDLLKRYYSHLALQSTRVVDLGSGDGRVVYALAKEFPQWDVRGIEINQELCESGQKLVKNLPNAHIVRGDLFLEDLTGVDIVFLFALPTIMPNLRHIFGSLTNHALIITFQYPLEIPEFPVKEIFNETLLVGDFTFHFFIYQPEVRQ